MNNRRVTISDVARAANVSRTLVSFVLNGRKDVAPVTRTRVLQAIEELGYRPNAIARNLATKRAGAIGIVCDMETYQDAFDMQFLAAMLALVVEMGHRVMLIPSDEQQIREVAQDHAVDGIIFLDEYVEDARMSLLLGLGMPAVGLWKDHLDSVLGTAIEELALHLVSRGHQRIVCLCGPQDKLFVHTFQQIVVNALHRHAIETTVLYCPPHEEAESILSIVREVKQEHVSAIVASSDKLAINALHGLHAARLRVPDDCAITGFGDVPSAQWVQPPLTTIRVAVKTIAQRVVADIFQGDELAAQHLSLEQDLPTGRLIVRRSC